MFYDEHNSRWEWSHVAPGNSWPIAGEKACFELVKRTSVGGQTEERPIRSVDHGGKCSRHTFRLSSTSSTDGASVEVLCLAEDYTWAFRRVVVRLGSTHAWRNIR